MSEFKKWTVTATRQHKSWNPADNEVTFSVYARTYVLAIKSARKQAASAMYFSKEDGRITYRAKETK
jgi:hypothetical protein